MIDDKRLQGTAQATDEDLVRGAKEHYEFVSRIACAYYNFIPRVLDEWLVMKQELLTLRQQNKALIEDAENIVDNINKLKKATCKDGDYSYCCSNGE